MEPMDDDISPPADEYLLGIGSILENFNNHDQKKLNEEIVTDYQFWHSAQRPSPPISQLPFIIDVKHLPFKNICPQCDRLILDNFSGHIENCPKGNYSKTEQMSEYPFGIFTGASYKRDYVGSLISFVGDALIERSNARAWAPSVMSQSNNSHEWFILVEILTQYAMSLEALAGSKQYRKELKERQNSKLKFARDLSGSINNFISATNVSWSAAKIISKRRHLIIRYFWENALLAPPPSEEESKRLAKLRRQHVHEDRLEYRDTQWELDLVVEDLLNEMAAYFDLVHHFLLFGEEFEQMATSVRQKLYCKDRASMEEISTILSRHLEESSFDARLEDRLSSETFAEMKPRYYKTKIITKWRLKEFLLSQFPGGVPRISSLVSSYPNWHCSLLPSNNLF